MTAFLRFIRVMNSSFCAHQQGHLNGDETPHPIEPRWRTPAALLLLAGGSPQRRRPCRPQSSRRLAFFALSKRARAHLEPQRSPCRPQSSQRLAFFALSRCARAHLEPQRSALPAHPIAAHSGASNCGFQVESRPSTHPARCQTRDRSAQIGNGWRSQSSCSDAGTSSGGPHIGAAGGMPWLNTPP